MNYLKCVLAGAGAVLGGMVLLILAGIVFVRLRFHTAAGFHVSLLRDLTVWATFLILFLLGFLVEYRRLR